MPRIAVVAPDGTTGTVEESELGLMPPGTKVAGGETEDSGGLLGSLAAGVLGAGSTATLGLTDKLAREVPYVLGGPKASHEVTSQLRMVRERNPYSTMAGEVGGLLLNPEAFSAAGEVAAAPVAARVGEGLLGKMATSAARVGAETALGGAQHQITEDSLNDHDLHAQAIWAEAAKEGMLGAVGGAALGLGGGLIGKAREATGLLARRSGPMSGAMLDELAGGVEGAGRDVASHADRAERTIEGLRRTGATTDQAIDMVNGLDMGAKARAATAPEGKGMYDWATDTAVDYHGSNPARAEALRKYAADAIKAEEGAVSSTDRAALDMTKAGNSFLRNGEDTLNEAQYTMKPDRFAKLVDSARVDAQADQIAGFLQKVDEKLSFWEGMADRGGNAGGVRDLRKQWTALNQDLVRIGTSDSKNLSRDLLIRFNKFKQTLDGHVPYGRSPGAVIDGGRQFFGLPAATRDFSELADVARGALEDESVWGPAGAAQARENLSFSENFERHNDMLSTYGESIDRPQGVRVPEFDYSKTRSVLDKVTGHEEIDEALQPIKSARAAIDRGRARIAALRESGELTEGQVAKLAQAEKDITTFESTLNGAMKDAAINNRIKADVLEEGHSGIGGLFGAGLDFANRPYAAIKRMAQIRHTYKRVAGGIETMLRAVVDSGGSSTEGVAARKVTPRSKDKIIDEMQNIRALAGNPAALEAASARMVGDMGKFAPKTAEGLRLTAQRALLYLAREAPPASVSGTGAFGTPKPRYSDVQIHDWESKRNAAFDPRDVIEDMKHGRINRDAVKTAKYVAPEMFADMQRLAQEQLNAMAARGELDRMPYQQQAMIASLLEVHADRTFEPDFMAMMQAAKAMPAPAPPPKRGGGGSSGAPAKPPGWMTTEAQKIEAGGTQ